MGTSSSIANGSDIAPIAPAPECARLFNFDAQGIRVVGTAETPWFVAKDVCAALEIINYRDALTGLDDDEKGVAITDTLGGPQEMATVNESGLYALIFRSRKPSARLFRKWVTGTVLPSIRKNGRFTARAEKAHYFDFYRPGQKLLGPHNTDSLSGGDLSRDHLQILATAILQGRAFAIVSLDTLAETLVREKVLPWVMQNPASMPERVALALYLRRRAGVPYSYGVGQFRVERLARVAKRRWVFITDEHPRFADTAPKTQEVTP